MWILNETWLCNCRVDILPQIYLEQFFFFDDDSLDTVCRSAAIFVQFGNLKQSWQLSWNWCVCPVRKSLWLCLGERQNCTVNLSSAYLKQHLRQANSPRLKDFGLPFLIDGGRRIKNEDKANMCVVFFWLTIMWDTELSKEKCVFWGL